MAHAVEAFSHSMSQQRFGGSVIPKKREWYDVPLGPNWAPPIIRWLILTYQSVVPTGHVSVVFWGSKNNTVQSRCEIEDILDYHTLCSINLWVRGLRFRTTSYHNELSFTQAMSQKSAREPPGRQAPQFSVSVLKLGIVVLGKFGKPPNQIQLFGIVWGFSHGDTNQTYPFDGEFNKF